MSARRASVLVAAFVAAHVSGVAAPTEAQADDPQTAGDTPRAPTRPATPEEAAREPGLDTPPPTEWLPPGPLGCVRRGAMRGMCRGPRRVPRPAGPDAERARALGLGTTRAAARLLLDVPEPRWVDATRGDALPLRPEPAASQATSARDPAGDATDATPTTARGDLLFPVSGAALWRGHGPTRRGRRRHNHQGIDLGAPAGTPFRAANDGLVAYSDNGLRGYGNLVIVVHPDATSTFYAHARASYVVAGQRVRRGQVLGEVGRSGLAHGDHLHFEWHAQGAAHNPLPQFTALPAGVTPSAAQLEDRVLPLDRSVFHRPRGRHARPRRRAERGARSRRTP